MPNRSLRVLASFVALLFFCTSAFAVTKRKSSARKTPVRVAKPVKKPPVAAKALKKHRPVKRAAAHSSGTYLLPGAGNISSGPWLEPTHVADNTSGDVIDGEDLTVRRAATAALGDYNGTVVVADPTTGRVLTIVNQKLAFRPGYQPCSTIKIVSALAGLSEGVIDRETNVHLYGRLSMNLTNAMAHSNNNYFANIGMKLGYDKVNYYARLFGLGEKAGLNIPEEQPGTLPDGPPENGGMAMMTSFGEGITLTPLELTALVSAVANGGTLYYLQHPRTTGEIKDFVPRVKRRLPIQNHISDIVPGMSGAVEFGTARRASYPDGNEQIFGKTGTCTDRNSPTHLGWFGSFNTVGDRKLAVVVLLTGGKGVSGPIASGVAGQVYHNLAEQKFFLTSKPISPVALINGTVW